MNTKFCKIENVELVDSKEIFKDKTAIVSLVSSFGGVEKGKTVTISARETSSLDIVELTLTRRQARELSKELVKWIDGKPLTEVN